MGKRKIVKILLVEFPRWEIRSIKESLSGKGRDFLVVEDIDAPMKILAYEPDLILSGTSGKGLEDILDAREELDDPPPVIIFSQDKPTIRSSLIKGCDDYILRPFEPFELNHRAQRYLPSPPKNAEDGIILGPAPSMDERKRKKALGDLDSGHIFLIREPKPVKGLEMFRNELKRGVRGLSLSRRNPKELRILLGDLDADLIWLTANMDRDETCIEAKDLTKITKALNNLIKDDDQGLIYIDSLEYLISQTDFQSILRLLQFMNDKIMVSSDQILISLDPRAFTSQEMSMVERECVIWNY